VGINHQLAEPLHVEVHRKRLGPLFGLLARIAKAQLDLVAGDIAPVQADFKFKIIRRLY
jgi:hypothetical protein